jgi:hypothetical protein
MPFSPDSADQQARMSSEHSPLGVVGPVRAACGLLLGAGVLLAVWAFVTFSRDGPFDTAVEAVFVHDPHADISVGWVELTYLAGPGLSLLFGLAYAGAAAVLLRRFHAWVAIVTVLMSIPVIALVVLAYLLNGRPYINAIGTGPDDATAIKEMGQVDRLTSWRFSGWYHALTLGCGLTAMAFIICAAVLLVISVSIADRS